MCTYIAEATPVIGSGYAHGEWIDLARAVVAVDHPQDAFIEHAVCIDFRGKSGDPAERVAVELDPSSARALAETILATLAASPAQPRKA